MCWRYFLPTSATLMRSIVICTMDHHECFNQCSRWSSTSRTWYSGSTMLEVNARRGASGFTFLTAFMRSVSPSLFFVLFFSLFFFKWLYPFDCVHAVCVIIVVFVVHHVTMRLWESVYQNGYGLRSIYIRNHSCHQQQPLRWCSVCLWQATVIEGPRVPSQIRCTRPSRFHRSDHDSENR